MKLLLKDALIEMTPQADGDTLAYFAYCLTASPSHPSTKDPFPGFYQRLEQRPDTRQLLARLQADYHAEILCKLLMGPFALPSAIDLAPYLQPADCKASVNPAPPPIVTRRKSLFQPDVLEALKTKLLSVLDEKDEQTTAAIAKEKQSLVNHVKNNEHGWWEWEDLHSKYGYPEHMAFLLNKLLWMTPEDQAYLNEGQVAGVLGDYPELYHPAVLNAWMKYLDFHDPANTPDPVEQAARVKQYLIMQSATLMRYSMPVQVPKVLAALNLYFRETIAPREEVKPALAF